MSKQRYQDIQSPASASAKTGVTGVLTPPPELDNREVTPPTPPTPQKPSMATLARATQKLGKELSSVTTETKTDIEETVEATAIAEQESSSDDIPAVDQVITEIQVEERDDTPLVSSDLGNDNKDTSEEIATVISQEDDIFTIEFNQAVALTAYLGWISKGALCDIFLISYEQAEKVITELKNQQIVEDADYPTLRFIRSVQTPNMNGQHPQE